MIAENNGIFLAGGDTVVYFAGQKMHKKNIPQHFFRVIHLVRTSYDRFFKPSPPGTHIYAFRVTPLLRT